MGGVHAEVRLLNSPFFQGSHIWNSCSGTRPVNVPPVEEGIVLHATGWKPLRRRCLSLVCATGGVADAAAAAAAVVVKPALEHVVWSVQISAPADAGTLEQPCAQSQLRISQAPVTIQLS